MAFDRFKNKRYLKKLKKAAMKEQLEIVYKESRIVNDNCNGDMCYDELKAHSMNSKNATDNITALKKGDEKKQVLFNEGVKLCGKVLAVGVGILLSNWLLNGGRSSKVTDKFINIFMK